jgi:hypothetical protein
LNALRLVPKIEEYSCIVKEKRVPLYQVYKAVAAVAQRTVIKNRKKARKIFLFILRTFFAPSSMHLPGRGKS